VSPLQSREQQERTDDQMHDGEETCESRRPDVHESQRLNLL